MNLDELAQAFRDLPNEKLLDDLAHSVDAWKMNERNIDELEAMVERFFGNAWLPSEKVHAKAYGLWEAFKQEAIRGIGGMTMNERLYFFSLFERFDACSTEEERNVIYGKLLAKR